MFKGCLCDLCAHFAVGCAEGVVLRSLVYPLSIHDGWVWISAPLLSRFALSLCQSFSGCLFCFVFSLSAISRDYFNALNKELMEQQSLLMPYIEEETETIKENVLL